jgi:integrase
MHAVADGETAARNKTARLRGVSHVCAGIGTASRTVGLLGAIFAYAMREDMRPDNPVRGVQRPADGRRDRRLSDAEYAALGAALRRAEGETVWPAAVGVTRFLALTGWRKGEALALRWRDVDLVHRTAKLPDTKTGRSMRPLSYGACDVLRGKGRRSDNALTGITTPLAESNCSEAPLACAPHDLPISPRRSMFSLSMNPTGERNRQHRTPQ